MDGGILEMGLTKMKIDKYNILEALMQSESRISLKDMREAIRQLHLPKAEENLLLNSKYREW